MTFLEKAMEIEKEKGSGMNIFQIMQNSCPSDYGFKDVECIEDGTEVSCISCWNREMPSEYPHNVQTDKQSVDLITEVSEQTQEHYYNKGLNDAWELAKKLWYLGNQKCKEIFGYEFSIDIIEHFTPQEAIAKLKAYEDSKIEVGDVVTTVNGECPYIVTNVQLPNTLHVINSRNGYAQQIRIDVCKKTGKHLNVQQFLKQIGE